MDSILTSVKKAIGGIPEEYEHFDPDIIMFINTVFSVLTQLGAGPAEGFSVKDKTAVWRDFMPDDPRLEFVKSYVTLRVKLMFDPPASSSVADSLKRTADELEWRIMMQSEKKEEIQNVGV
ncbi:MAG: hypothetical protein NC120_07220 [Ruminococcus sp.]|nr:hypothetical protein [Ruminococcus sp.]